MRILILSSLAENSGCHLRARYLSEALRRQGHAVVYVSPLPGLPFMLDILFSLLKYSWKVFSTEFDFGFCIKPYPNALLPLLLKRFINRSVRIGTDIDDMDHGYRTGILPRILRAIQKPLPRLCDLVTCHNDALEDWIPGEYGVSPGRIYRLDQGVDLGLFHPSSIAERRSDISACRGEWGLKSGPLLVYTAHLNIASDLDDILDAFRIVSSKTSATLLVAGGGPMLSHFRSLTRRLGLGKRVVFTGSLSPEQIRTCVNAADFCLVYYKDKTVNHYRTSMKVRECLAMARPVIANDVGDLRLFKRFVYPAGSGPQTFATGILKALSRTGPDGREKNGSRFIAEKFNWDTLAGKFARRLADLTPVSRKPGSSRG